ncbi:MAG: hypothetical protein AB7F82_07925 [Alphaproteobacteria bacterium]
MLQQHYETILSWLCTSVEHLSSNPAEEVFKLRDKKEARMAFDVFNTLGFKVKIYDDEDSSRLYIAKPQFDKETLVQKLESARAYSAALKQIQKALQGLRSSQKDVCDYSVNLLNNPDNSVRIHIVAYKEDATRRNAEEQEKTPAAVQVSAPSTSPAAPSQRPGSTRKKDEFSARVGPAIAKTHLMQDENGKEKDATQRWLYTHLLNPVFNNGAQILALIIMMLILSAIVVTSKAFLCPDFAVDARNTPWYCSREQIRQIITNEKPMPEVQLPDMK